MKNLYSPYASTSLLNMCIVLYISVLFLQNTHGTSNDLHVNTIVEIVWRSYVKHGEKVVNWNYVASGQSYEMIEEVIKSQFFLDHNEHYKEVVRGHELSYLPNPISRLKKIFAGERLTLRQWSQINTLFAYLYGQQREYKSHIDKYFKKRLNSLASSLEDPKSFDLDKENIFKATNQFYEKIVNDIPENIEELYPYENFDLSAAILEYLREDTTMLEKFYSVEKATDGCCRLQKLSRFEKFQKNVAKYPIFHVEEKLLTTLRVYKLNLKFDVNSALAKHYQIIISKIKANHKVWNRFKTIQYLHSNLFYFEHKAYEKDDKEVKENRNLVLIDGTLCEVNEKSFDYFIFLHAFDNQFFNEYLFPTAYLEWKYKPIPIIERPLLIGSDKLDHLHSVQVSEDQFSPAKMNLLPNRMETNLVDLDGENQISILDEKSDSLKNSQFGLTIMETNEMHTDKDFVKIPIKSFSSSALTADTSNVLNSYGSSRLLTDSDLKSSPRHLEESNGPELKIIEDYFSPDFKTSPRLRNLYASIDGESPRSLNTGSVINDDWITSKSYHDTQMDKTISTDDSAMQNGNYYWFKSFFTIFKC